MKFPSPATIRTCAALAWIIPFVAGCDVSKDAPPQPVQLNPDSPLTSSPPVAATRSSTPDQIKGKVLFEGTPPPPRTIAMDPVCGKLHPASVIFPDYAIGQGNGLANVFVHLKDVPGSFPPPTEEPLLDQEGCLYKPSILTVWAGQPFKVRNSDALLHNVHSFPENNKSFNFGQVVKGQVTTKTFDQPEALIRIKCDVHPWMICHINVVNHPFHAITDQDGNFSFPPNLPPGTYTIEAIHPKAGAVTRQITVPQTTIEPVTLTLKSE